jgi:hypothetical protein
MIKFLQNLGASCCHFYRARLARSILGLQTSHVPSCRGTLLDFAVMQGDIEKIQVFREANKKADLTQDHWKDFIVQDYFLKLQHLKTMQTLEICCLTIPKAIISIICEFRNDWKDLAAELDILK